MSFDDEIALEEANIVDKSAGTGCSAESDRRFQLLAKLISSPEALSNESEKFQKLEKLIRSDFLKLCSGIGMPGESSLYNDLLLLLKKLHELVEFPYLANKNILAVGGGFSTGKSRFLNSILGVDQLLPEGILPTTAIPTYLISGDREEEILALNSFNRSQPLDRCMLSEISHAFNMDKSAGTLSFYHILKLIQVKSRSLPWDNIALLDTPGYSKPHSETDGDAQKGTDAGNTDEEKAKEHLSMADYLIWTVSATNGTIQTPDIEFLRDKVKWQKPVYLLINKADQKGRLDMEAIFDRMQEDMEDAGFELAGISAYSSRRKEVIIGDDPKDWFEDINGKYKYTQWRGRFKAVFEKIIQFNEEESKRCRDLKAGLDPVYLKGDSVLSSEQMSKLKATMDAIKKESQAHSEAAKHFAVFSGKAEGYLDDLLNEIGVKEETASAHGIEGRWRSPNRTLPSLQKDDTIVGTVDTLSKVRGCFVSSPELPDQVRIRYPDITDKYTDPSVFFAPGKQVAMTVYEISRADSSIVFIITPNTQA